MSENKFELYLPTICTRGIVIFPNQKVIIEVARHKSLNALEEANLNFDGHVFLVCQRELMVEDPALEDLYNIGTVCKVDHVQVKDNYLRVTFKGLERAKINTFEDDENIIFSEVKCLANIESDVEEEARTFNDILYSLKNMSQIKVNIPSDFQPKDIENMNYSDMADNIAQYLQIDLYKKQQLLEELDVLERLKSILVYINDTQEEANIENRINETVKERMENSQKEYILREKLRAIKEELGDVSNVSDDTEKIRKMIDENPYPEHVKVKAYEELKRYEMLPASSSEAGVIRSYLDWLLQTPWYQVSQDNDDLEKAENILNENHFGLDKVKERILEYLAVKQMTNSLKSPIICLVGPPGVGKTSLARSVATSLDRKFVKMSLGGVRDEAEIRGHRRTYLGSMPGRIIQGMKKVQVTNPVFLIDEIDKMASDYKGDPASAMLEVLDPEQNSMFSDHYLEEPYDLSNVLFIATANYLENIPNELRDRLEIINLSSYTEVEKVEIAKRHLIRKQLINNGLKASQFKISDPEMLYLIRHYTREAGVRQLERIIGSLCRKTVLAILKGERKSVKVSRKLIKEYLGKEIFEYGDNNMKNQVGVVTGLAYTSFGGDTLPVEVNYFEGKGKFMVTGQLGDVMKESTSIALDYIKSNAKKYKIDPKFFEMHDIHIHVPEGAVPKDGPSAGVTLATALVSAITNTKVNNALAMTGEITLRGNVLPIGGLREKSIAAHRIGIKTIIIPKKNTKDLDDVPQIVKDDINYIPVETLDQVFANALVKE